VTPRDPAPRRNRPPVDLAGTATEALRSGLRTALVKLLVIPGAARPLAPVERPSGRRLQIVELEDDVAERYTHESVYGLHDASPAQSAASTLVHRQRRGLVVGAALVLLVGLLFPQVVLVALTALASLGYAVVVCHRLRLFQRSLDDVGMVHISAEDALAIPAAELPIYTILVPAYREPQVIGRLLSSLEALDYPHDKLDIKLLLEEDDELTLDAVRAASPESHIAVVLVPPSEPRTKPKACNFGRQLARGEFITIYDAEDRPEPLQLRRAVAAFRSLPANVTCLQARLEYWNGGQNAITKWFDAEYLTWFGQLLPGLVRSGAPIPLGGTSNHLRTSTLDEVGGWDPFNVTEDADLGIRLHRRGGHVRVLDSVTLEEANSDFVNWAKQRSRWYKGYLQTWIVHLRHPRQLWRELGPKGFLGFNLFVGGTPLLAILNPVFWTLTLLWAITQANVIADLFPGPVYFLALACFILGNASIIYMNVLTVRLAGRPELLLSALLSPVYWLMMSIASIKAAVQLVVEPSYWEKTEHGLSDDHPAAA
jgi:cellulose synthase/poly-beta-1,6-N-acetylglucosamine synthase-like glycosyltransferase